MAEITMERVLALAAEFAEVIETVGPRAMQRAKALGEATQNPALVDWSIEDGEFVGRWVDVQCGSRDNESVWLPFEAAAMNDADFAVYIGLAVAAATERKADDARRAQAKRDAADRAEYDRLAARFGTVSNG